MATLVDERLEDDNPDEEITTFEQEEEQEAPQESTPEPPQEEEEIPEKYQGKSTAEIVRMHQEAEKLLGRQSGEVGELRSVVDSYIQTQLDTKAPPAPTEDPDEDVDFFSDPDKAVARAIANHPSIKQAEQANVDNKRNTARTQLQERHPDMPQILQDAKFVEWIKNSKIRTQLFAQADRGYDYDAADELLSNWKERQGVVSQTLAAEKDGRKAAIKTASTGSTKGNGQQQSRKIYRRSDIIKLMQDDPERYLALSDEIGLAYAEKRVR